MAFVLWAYTAWAAPVTPGSLPAIIPYQGTLTTAAGQAVNGNTGLTFKLYAAPTGGTALALWTEAHTGVNAVPVTNGLFNVTLGSLTAIPASVWNNPLLYLGITVGSEAEMSPREQLEAVPAAMQAGTALTVVDNGIKAARTMNGDAVTVSTQEVELAATTVTVSKPSSVLVIADTRAISGQNGDNWIFEIYRNGQALTGNTHLERSSATHQYFSLTWLDPNLAAGQYTYTFKARLDIGSGSRLIHQPNIATVVIPQ